MRKLQKQTLELQVAFAETISDWQENDTPLKYQHITIVLDGVEYQLEMSSADMTHAFATFIDVAQDLAVENNW